jgi:hypothetical protein
MPFYNENPDYNTLKWDDIFTSSAEFIAKVKDVGGITDETKLTELYDILSLKYVTSYTRYTSEFPFIMGIKRELYVAFPFYLKRKELANEMMEMEIEEIQLGTRQLRNLVDTHDEPIANASTSPFNDLSTQQEYIRVTNNKLDAVKEKYQVMSKNYLQGIYAQCDGLFRVILSEDTKILFSQGEE